MNLLLYDKNGPYHKGRGTSVCRSLSLAAMVASAEMVASAAGSSGAPALPSVGGASLGASAVLGVLVASAYLSGSCVGLAGAQGALEALADFAGTCEGAAEASGVSG